MGQKQHIYDHPHTGVFPGENPGALRMAGAAVRQLTHYAQHVGQIVLLAKHLRGEAWRTLSIPKRRGPGPA